jgi:hypothetical protein
VCGAFQRLELLTLRLVVILCLWLGFGALAAGQTRESERDEELRMTSDQIIAVIARMPEIERRQYLATFEKAAIDDVSPDSLRSAAAVHLRTAAERARQRPRVQMVPDQPRLERNEQRRLAICEFRAGKDPRIAETLCAKH